jgi:hypothetical protein
METSQRYYHQTRHRYTYTHTHMLQPTRARTHV